MPEWSKVGGAKVVNWEELQPIGRQLASDTSQETLSDCFSKIRESIGREEKEKHERFFLDTQHFVWWFVCARSNTQGAKNIQETSMNHKLSHICETAEDGTKLTLIPLNEQCTVRFPSALKIYSRPALSHNFFLFICIDSGDVLRWESGSRADHTGETSSCPASSIPFALFLQKHIVRALIFVMRESSSCGASCPLFIWTWGLKPNLFEFKQSFITHPIAKISFSRNEANSRLENSGKYCWRYAELIHLSEIDKPSGIVGQERFFRYSWTSHSSRQFSVWTHVSFTTKNMSCCKKLTDKSDLSANIKLSVHIFKPCLFLDESSFCFHVLNILITFILLFFQ